MTLRMTHQEAIDSLSSMFTSQTDIANHIGTSQQHWSKIKKTGRLPAKYWQYVSAEPVTQVGPPPTPSRRGDINVETLTLSQARRLYEQLKEFFG